MNKQNPIDKPSAEKIKSKKWEMPAIQVKQYMNTRHLISGLYGNKCLYGIKYSRGPLLRHVLKQEKNYSLIDPQQILDNLDKIAQLFAKLRSETIILQYARKEFKPIFEYFAEKFNMQTIYAEDYRYGRYTNHTLPDYMPPNCIFITQNHKSRKGISDVNKLNKRHGPRGFKVNIVGLNNLVDDNGVYNICLRANNFTYCSIKYIMWVLMNKLCCIKNQPLVTWKNYELNLPPSQQ